MSITVIRRSPHTGKVNYLNLNITAEAFMQWCDKVQYVQEAFPSLTADEREFLLTGYHPGEFEEACGYPEEEDKPEMSIITGAVPRSYIDIIKAVAEAGEKAAAWREENEMLREYLAISKADCVYCGLAKEEMTRCEKGFPGCNRADDIIACIDRRAAREQNKENKPN